MRTNLQVTRKPNSKFILIRVNFESARNKFIALEIYRSEIERNGSLKVLKHKQVLHCIFFLLYAGFNRENEYLAQFKDELKANMNYAMHKINLDRYTLIDNPRDASVVTVAKIQEYANKWTDIQVQKRIYAEPMVYEDDKMEIYWYIEDDLDDFFLL